MNLLFISQTLKSRAAFSFSINKGKNDKPVLFVSMIQQYSWNDDRKTGSLRRMQKS